MRKALIVGIDHYDHIGSLSGCVNDAHSVRAALERHADGTLNFTTPQLLTGTGAGQPVIKKDLKDAVREVFADDAEIIGIELSEAAVAILEQHNFNPFITQI